MERRDKIRALLLLESGEISLDKFMEIIKEDEELNRRFVPQKLWQEYTEAWESLDKELTTEERLDRIDEELMCQLADCSLNQRPAYPYECTHKYRDLEDVGCQACEERRKLWGIKKNA